MSKVLVMGAVAYDPKVVTIWDGFRRYLRFHGLPFEYLLYPHYEMQVEDLVAGRIHAAWNSPLAWIRATRLAAARGHAVSALAMRDTDRDLASVLVVRNDSAIREPADLAGLVVATGATDSPQATLIPRSYLAGLGVPVTARAFDVGIGLHGDHIGGERDAARALVNGEVDAAFMLDANHLLFGNERILPTHGTRIIARTQPFDHCNMTVVDSAPPELAARFIELLLGMSYADAQVRQLLDLEGLTSWEKGRTAGYTALATAVDLLGFYGPDGEVLVRDYPP
jgi:ABC-type phosphate/phosphonate transport system substrate-binding protein